MVITERVEVEICVICAGEEDSRWEKRAIEIIVLSQGQHGLKKATARNA